ncbi:MAG: hypothetical protein QOF95_2596, partial [Pseudonocardiales bacterium]|nr:hypothetical protein [Pseudonocardiales bacterium]
MSTAAEEPVEPGSVVLTEPVRLRAVQFAAEVLARMPPDEVPTALRSIARFTPAKRVRLGGAALAAALDADADFRAKVAEVIAEGSPQLVEAVRDGTSTAASDPIDTALVAYLTRPDGWIDIVAQANVRWAAGRQHGDATTEQIGRLRAELAELRAKAKGEPARVRQAVQGAEQASAAELADLRRQVRARTGELRAAAQELAETQAAVADAQRRIEAAASAQEAELRRVRSRVAELERAAEASRRGARADRDVDDARLWLLVETL